MTIDKLTEIIDDIEGLIDIETEEFSDQVGTHSLAQWRRYLYSLHKKESEMEGLITARDEIVSRYNHSIDAKRSVINIFKEFLKMCLENSPDLKTKTGGFGIKVPGIGSISASKEIPALSITSDFDIEPFMVEQPPVFSREKFNETYKQMIEDGSIKFHGDNIADSITGEIIPGVSIEKNRRWKFLMDQGD